MRRSGIAALCAVLACATPARADDATDHAFVEVTAPRDTYHVGEPIRLRLRAGYDAPWFKEHAVALFRSPLDVPIQIEAPWIPTPQHRMGGGPSVAVALNGERVEFQPSLPGETRNGARFDVVWDEYGGGTHPPGEIVYAAPVLRFAYANRFAEDALGVRVPVDRADARVEGRPLRITVLPLPREGRPPAFSGVVGRLTVRADLYETIPRENGTMRLHLDLLGDANLQSLPAPPQLALDGFHVYGVIEQNVAGGRMFVYDIAPLRADVATVPAIEFAYFDTTPPAQYRVARTAPIPFTPRAGPSRTPAQPEPESQGFPVIPAVALGAAALAVAVVLVRRRRPAPAAVDPVVARAHAAAAQFRARAPGDTAEAFPRFVAACLQCPPAAVVSPDLVPRLEAAGVPAQLARRAAALVERLVSARYGGASDSAADDAEAGAIVSAWEAAAASPPPRAR